ncbi:MAG: putative isomerase protein [Paucimonas sp.]|nr:putative isomerase protein [Paucimonas sp.]
MKLLKRFESEPASEEYGLRGWRTLPWEGLDLPFGAAYCIVAPHTDSLQHVNHPADEDELFICIRGNAYVVVGEQRQVAGPGDQFAIPRRQPHFISNPFDEPFHFYAVWWNPGLARDYLMKTQALERPEWEI